MLIVRPRMLSRVVARRVPPPPQPSVVVGLVVGQAGVRWCFGVGGCLREGVARRPWMAGGIGMDESSSWQVIAQQKPVS